MFQDTAARALLANPKVSSQAKSLSWALIYDVLSHFQSIWKKSIDGPLRKLGLKIFQRSFMSKFVLGLFT